MLESSAAACLERLRDPDLRRDLGRRAHEHATLAYDVDRTAKRYLEAVTSPTAPERAVAEAALETPRLGVLFSFVRDLSKASFTRQLARAVEGQADVRFFSWRAALTGAYDVLHVHWPERLLRHPTWRGRAAKRVLFVALLARLTVRRTAVVQTLHNIAPHEAGGMAEDVLLRRLHAQTDVWIRLNRHTPVPRGGRTVTIPHGHYLDVLGDGVPRPVPGRILLFGLLRPYKGAEELMDAFRALDGPDLTLRVVGRPLDDEIAVRLRSLARRDVRTSLVLAHVPDDVLADEVRAAELVVLPYREMHNSGALLTALSFGVPVLVPRGPVNAEIADEVGQGWVHQFDAPVTADAIGVAIEAVRQGGRSTPRLGARDWASIGDRHVEAYTDAIRAARRRGLRSPRRRR